MAVFSNKKVIDFFREEKSFLSICNAAVEGILVVDRMGTIKMANKAAAKMFGYEHLEFTGLNINSLIPKRLRKTHKNHMNGYNLNPEPRKMGEGRDLLALRQDGSQFSIEISLSQTIINNNQVSIAFCVDISKRKQAEKALRMSEEQLLMYTNELEDKVEDRTEKLRISVEALEIANTELHRQIKVREQVENEIKLALEKERDLNELKSRFLSIASHEFRTPLSTILSSASLIARYTDDASVEKREKHVKRIKSSVSNLINILDDFLSLEKLEAGRISTIIGDCDLENLIQEVIEEINVILKKGQSIVLKTKGKAVLIQSDQRLLKNVLINLTSNASKYSPENSNISISLSFLKTVVKLTIADQGIGIPYQDQKHLFTRFFRAGNATNLDGTGLGLNIVRKYLELLGGDIDFKSKLNEGTSFVIQLPIISRP